MKNHEDIKKQIQNLDSSILDTIAFLIYELENKGTNELFMLAKLLDEDSLHNLIKYYNGATIKIPSIEEYKKSSFLAFLFYLIDIVGLDFKSALSFLEKEGFELDMPRNYYGKRISYLRKELYERMKNALEELKENGK